VTITNKVSLKSVNGGNTPIADVPDAPTIGTATGGATSASITFTAATTGGAVTTFTATSTPGSVTGTSATSPISVTGLTGGTAYTFKVKGTNTTATGPESAASNSVTPIAPAWEQIATVSPTSTNLVNFSSIPDGYSVLKIIGLSNTVAESILWTRINEVGANYAEYGYYGGASSTISTAGNSASSTLIRRIASNSSASTLNAPFYVTYFNANSTSVHKQVQITSGYSTASNLDFTISQGSLNALASKITSIYIGTGNGPGVSNFAASSRFTLYGLKVGA